MPKIPTKTTKHKNSKKVNSKKVKNFKLLYLSIPVALLGLTAYMFTPVISPKIVYIPQGSVFKTVSHLQKRGVNLHLLDAFFLKILGQPQQGWIDLKEEKLARIRYLYRLTTSKAATTDVTLIPGETTVIFLKQIAQQLSMDPKKLQESYDELSKIPEGMFSPNTYNLPRESNEKRIIDFLLTRSEEQNKKLSEELIGKYDPKEWLHIVTLASVIQKEAASVNDMPMVSSVIQNRIEQNMRLQMDGTLNYGEFSHQKVTASKIRNDKTSYNTYKHQGLPDYPVCNVSKEAIVAALHPKHTDYLYFVRGKNGEHIYSSYFSTHHQNIVNATK
jgi:UPF0755 protein